MITLECDNCERTFEVDEARAGEKVPCPHCGDVNRVPEIGEAGIVERVRSRPAEPHAPAPEREQTIMTVRSAMFRAHPFLYLLMVALGAGGVVLMIWTRAAPLEPHWTWVGLGMFIVAWLWWLIWWLAPHRWMKLTITTRRSILQEGIIMRKTSEVLHNHIRNIKIEQSFLQRILGVGMIEIDSAGGEENNLIEIRMRDVPGPYEVKTAIDKFRDF